MVLLGGTEVLIPTEGTAGDSQLLLDIDHLVIFDLLPPARSLPQGPAAAGQGALHGSQGPA